jgi:predicted N-acetyltransferase YhbS
MLIRPAKPSDTDALLGVERAAFGGGEEAALVEALLADPSATPIINLIAEEDGEIVGHVLFTHAVARTAHANVAATCLAPLAVAPSAQGQGIGQALSMEGIAAARMLGIGLVFVLGHIDYYPRIGFRPAAPLGLLAPYPIDPKVADAWMVLETEPGLLGKVQGTVLCADALMSPEMWVE